MVVLFGSGKSSYLCHRYIRTIIRKSIQNMEKKEQNIRELQKQWEPLWDALEAANTALNAFLAGGLSVADQQRVGAFIEKWDALKTEAETYYDAIDRQVNAQPDPVSIELPWQGDKFKDAWQYWKDYLREQHRTYIKSRAERKMLARLKKISDGDEQRAIEYLDFAESTLYRNFFKVTEREYQKPAQTERRNDDGDF